MQFYEIKWLSLNISIRRPLRCMCSSSFAPPMLNPWTKMLGNVSRPVTSPRSCLTCAASSTMHQSIFAKSFLFNASITHLEDPPQQRGTVIEEGTHSKFPLLFENIYRCRGVRAIKFSKDGDKHTGSKFWKRQSMDAAG